MQVPLTAAILSHPSLLPARAGQNLLREGVAKWPGVLVHSLEWAAVKWTLSVFSEFYLPALLSVRPWAWALRSIIYPNANSWKDVIWVSNQRYPRKSFSNCLRLCTLQMLLSWVEFTWMPPSCGIAFLVSEGRKQPRVLHSHGANEPQQWPAGHGNCKGALMTHLSWQKPKVLQLDLRVKVCIVLET